MTALEQEYREIPLTKGKVAIVDAADYDWLNQWKWHAQIRRRTGLWYAHRKIWIGRMEGKKHMRDVSMHRQILGLERGDPQIIDHANGDGLDNRRENLRFCTYTQNAQNSRIRKDNKSGYKGVYLHLPGRWRSRIKVDGRYICLGVYKNPEEAAEAYRRAAQKYFGEFARL